MWLSQIETMLDVLISTLRPHMRESDQIMSIYMRLRDILKEIRRLHK